MSRLKKFLLTSLIGGLVVVLPIAILIWFFKWILSLVVGMLQPITWLLMKVPFFSHETTANLAAGAVIVVACFFIGLLAKTRLGSLLYLALDELLGNAPGYETVKEVVLRLLGVKKSPFSSVVMVDISGNGLLVTAFVTDEHKSGMVTVFVPTSPNPTSGFILNMSPERVQRVDIPVEKAMRNIISCGIGSGEILDAYQRAKSPAPVSKLKS